MNLKSIPTAKEDRSYLIALKTEYKLLEQKFVKAKNELNKWNERITLAEQKNMQTLKKEAEIKAESIQSELNYLTGELIKLKVETENLTKSFKNAPPELSIDPASLLKNLNNLIGKQPVTDLKSSFMEIKAENELEKIKEEMKSRGDI